jgi:alkylation response protein AidB-like acyl-CoA dehydrogenase
VDFDLSDVQRAWQEKGASLGRELGAEPTASDVMMGAARFGLLDRSADLLSIVLAVEALAAEAPAAGAALALHTAGALSLTNEPDADAVFRGEMVAALTLATDEVPIEDKGTLRGRASWVAPISRSGIAVIGARSNDALVACAVELDDPSVRADPIPTAALRGLVCGHLTLDGTRCRTVGPTLPVMSRARIFIAAAGLGIGRRAVRESLGSVRGTSKGAGGEQSVQGLVADAATELDAAMLLTWKAATSPLSLADASMAKLATAGAALRAVERATQAVGADSFRAGHIIERLAQDVRALELFAGRTEALREAVAETELPRV